MLIAYLVVALFGLAFGSFLNVCIYRLPRGESVVTPRSRCPRCQRLIRWYDNLPLLSFVLLRARCRECKQPISPVYPLVEAVTAFLAVVTYWRYGLSPEFVKFSMLGMLLIILFFTDLFKREIPRPVTRFGIVLGLLLSLIIPVDSRPLNWLLARAGFHFNEPAMSLLGAVGGGLIGGGIFYGIGKAFYYLGGRQKEYLGFGDVMLMLMVGIFLGPPLTLLTILLGSLAGTLVALPLELLLPRFRHYQWPYGSFLAAAAAYAAIDGNSLLDAYLRMGGLA